MILGPLRTVLTALATTGVCSVIDTQGIETVIARFKNRLCGVFECLNTLPEQLRRGVLPKNQGSRLVLEAPPVLSR